MKTKKRILISMVLSFFLFFHAACAGRGGMDAPVTTEKQELTEESSLEVHYIDVGQGDATLLVCDGEAMLIDAGKNDQGTALQMYLNSQAVTSLRYVIGTHPDSDHIGGMDVILTKFDCETVLLTDEEKDTATYRDVVDAMRYKGNSRTSPEIGDVYELGSATFTIVGPTELCEDSNDNSIAIVVQHGENRFYFEGDASEKEEADILGTGIDIEADVYKTGHHGSKSSTTDELLAAVNPSYAVISAGEGNSYGHPTAEVLNKLRSAGVSVFRTDEQGTIVAVSDGTSITWNCSPSESWQAGEPNASSDTKKEEKSSSGSSRKTPVKAETEEAAPSESDAAEEATPVETETEEAASSDEAEEETPAATEKEEAASSEQSEETSAPSNTAANETMVHITQTGTKYHISGCTYLKDSDIEISLEDAKARGYEPCKKCCK